MTEQFLLSCFSKLIQKLIRDRMEESGYDIPTDLIDCITTNYLFKNSPPLSPRESPATSLGQYDISKMLEWNDAYLMYSNI